MNNSIMVLLMLLVALPNFATQQESLSDESIESLSKILKPEVVSSLYEFKANLSGNSLDPDVANIAAAAVAGAAGGAAAKLVEVLLDRIMGEKKDEKVFIIDSDYFDASSK